MSCGLNPDQQAVLDKLTTLSSADGIIGIMEALPFTFPTTGQGLAEAAGFGTQYAKLIPKIREIESFITNIENGIIPEISLPPQLDSLQNDIKGVIEKVKPQLATATDVFLNAEQLANEVTILKNKWGNIDLGAGGIENLPNLIKSGAVDLEKLCSQIPNFEKGLDGLTNILKGQPITVPDEAPEEPELSGQLAAAKLTNLTQDFTRRAQEIKDEFAGIEAPKLLNNEDPIFTKKVGEKLTQEELIRAMGG